MEEPSGEESRGAEASGGGGGGFQIIGLKQNDWDKTVSWLLFFSPSTLMITFQIPVHALEKAANSASSNLASEGDDCNFAEEFGGG